LPSIVAAAGLALAAPVEAGCTLIKLAELPVTMHGLRPTITAQVNGVDTPFLVDSGAFFSFLSAANAAKRGLPVTNGPFGLMVSGVGHGEAQVSQTRVKDFRLGGVMHHDVDFLVLDNGGAAAGNNVIGQNVLSTVDVEYDLANGVIRLFHPEGCGYNASLAYWVTDGPVTYADIEPVDIRQAHTRGWASVNGRRIQVTIDTGAPMSMLSTQAASRAGVTPSTPGAVLVGDSSGVARNSYFKIWRAPFDSFAIGDEQIKNIRLLFGDMDLQGGSDMLLGSDFFLSHRVLVSNSQHRMYFTYNGGPVFNLDRPLPPAQPNAAAQPAPAAAPNTGAPAAMPHSADEFARRAAASMATRDFQSAISDWTQAMALAPTEARYAVQRAIAEIGNRQTLLAMADLDQAVQLKPDGIPAHLARGELLFAEREPDKAKADLDAAAALAAKDPDQQLAVAVAYARVGLDKDAIAQLDPWLAGHPVDDRRAGALNERCWLSTLLNIDLGQALIDCDEALKLRPGEPSYLDSRGLTYLRSGEVDRALSDFDASLRVRPNSAWTLYGRGLVELRKGMANEGQADIAAALAIQPRLADQAKKYGLAP
jgi:predicted aspartyl protease/tetratricopeptide (TPR) repeat protein